MPSSSLWKSRSNGLRPTNLNNSVHRNAQKEGKKIVAHMQLLP